MVASALHALHVRCFAFQGGPGRAPRALSHPPAAVHLLLRSRQSPLPLPRAPSLFLARTPPHPVPRAPALLSVLFASAEWVHVCRQFRSNNRDWYHKFTDYYYYWSVCTGERPYRLQGFQRILRRFELEFTVIKCERLTNSGVLLWLFEEWVLWRYLPSGNCEVPFPSIFKSEYLWSVVSSSTVINLEVLRH